MELKQNMFLRQGSYRIEKVLGQGGFGITYLAEQVLLGRKVAIKEFFMKEHCNRDANTFSVSVPSVGSRETVERFRQKFLKEARTIASFVSSNIVNVIDVFEENGTAYYVMEYLDGKSLGAIVAECGALDEALAVRYICQVADALMEVHGKNLLHLDIKPANVMLDSKGNAVLIDFGISKHYDDEGSQTSSGLIGISDGYAPMEQYKKGGLDSFTPATDIYALGAMLFKLVTSVTPPHASDINDDGLPALPDSISPAVRSAIKSAMQPRRKDRPQSIEEFLGKLKEQRAKSKDASFDNTSSNSSSTHRGEVSRSDGGESDLPTLNTENAKSYTASPDDEETLVGMNPPLPSATPPFEKAGELSNGVNDDDETLLNSSSTPRGEVSRSDGGESDLPTLNTENAKNYTASSDDDETRVGINPLVLWTLPLLKKWESFQEQLFLIKKRLMPKTLLLLVKRRSESPKKTVMEIIIAAIVLLGVAICFVAGGSDNENESYNSDSLSYTSNDDSNSDSNIDSEEKARLEREAEAQRQREEEERLVQQQSISTSQKVDLGLSVCWAGWNVGASAPEDYGGYYAWGETEEKDSYDWSTYKWCRGSYDTITKYCTDGDSGKVDNKTVLASTDDVAHVKWGGTWRMPTRAEQDELLEKCNWTWTTYKGVEGYIVTGPNGNSIFLPATGYRDGMRAVHRGRYGSYWYSSLDDLNCFAFSLYFDSGKYARTYGYRYNGRSVRPVSE